MLRSCFFACLLVGAASCYGKDLATIGSRVITTESYQSALKALGPQGERVATNPAMREKFLDHIINSQLVADKALKEHFDRDPAFQARLKDVTTQLLAGEYMDRYLEQQVTDAAVKKYFDEHRLDFSKKEVRASHILLSTKDAAENLLKQLGSPGAKFDDIAKKNSKDKSVDLGFFSRGRMVPEFEKVAFSTPKGSLHPSPVQTQFGWHIIKVTDERGTDDVAFDTVKDEAKKRCKQALQEQFVRDLRKSTKVVVHEDALKDLH